MNRVLNSHNSFLSSPLLSSAPPPQPTSPPSNFRDLPRWRPRGGCSGAEPQRREWAGAGWPGGDNNPSDNTGSNNRTSKLRPNSSNGRSRCLAARCRGRRRRRRKPRGPAAVGPRQRWTVRSSGLLGSGKPVRDGRGWGRRRGNGARGSARAFAAGHRRSLSRGVPPRGGGEADDAWSLSSSFFCVFSHSSCAIFSRLLQLVLLRLPVLCCRHRLSLGRTCIPSRGSA